MGLLDLASPALTLLDRGLGLLLPWDGVRIAAYGAASGWLSIVLYRWLSRQDELAALAHAARETRRELAAYDGPFEGLRERIAMLNRLGTRHLGLAIVPAVLGTVPMLFILAWLSNRFSYEFPPTGTPIAIRIEPAQSERQLRWSDPTAVQSGQSGEWRIAWPSDRMPLSLYEGDLAVVTLPTSAAVPVIHVRDPVWNLIVENPAGYLVSETRVRSVLIGLPPVRYLPWGPHWASGWETVYFAAMLIVALWLRARWGVR